MDKNEKLKILNKLIGQTREASITTMLHCVLEARNFVIHAKVYEIKDWLHRIDLTKTDYHRYENIALKLLQRDKESLVQILLAIKSQVELYPDVSPEPKIEVKKHRTNRVFIVHGHNNEMKLSVSSVITKLGLEPIILHEQPNKGRTIIEKFERLSHDVSFAVVLLSPDDAMPDGKYRARQNVILELGYFVAKLGRENVIALYADDGVKQCEIPSDISGVLYEPYKADGAWSIELVQELQAAGFTVDANALIKL